MNDDRWDNDDCPFTYKKGEEPEPIVHDVTGKCVHCSEDSHTVDSNGDKSCFPCAYDDASW